jgi:tripartite ATP-independent transporter DctP family solute receptor
MRISTNQAATSTSGKSMAKLVELINAQSKGRIKATANYGAELGSQSEQVAMCRTGSLEMVLSAPGTGPGTWVPQLMMFEFPYLFTDNAQFRRVLKGMEGEITKLVEPYGFIAMGGQSMGIRDILSKKPVTKLEDMKNMKFRGPNAVYVSMFQHLGAAGTTMDWNDVYSGLQTNLIDGMEASPSMINSMKFQDVAKNLTVTDHVIAGLYQFYNAKWFNSLPADLQIVVRNCAQQATDYQAQIDDKDQQASLDAMKAAGVNIIQLTDKDKWVAACKPMLAEYRAKGVQWSEFIDKLLAIK